MDGELAFGKKEIREYLETLPQDRKYLALIDKVAYDLHSETINEYLEMLQFLTPLQVASGEATKTFGGCENVMKMLLENNFQKSSLLLTFGGGSLIDLATVVAGNAFRGVGHVVFPTTLLSQVDSGIGGKGALNVQRVKNAFGCIHFPMGTCIDPHFISTLSAEELRSGWGEILKHSLLQGEDSFRHVETQILEDTPIPSDDLIKSQAVFKQKVVENDPFEVNDQRVFLNLGHTFGHALESLTGVPHGVAVAWGCGVSLILSRQYMNLDPEICQRGLQVCRKIVGPLALDPHEAWLEIQNKIRFDKKWEPRGLKIVLLRNLGEPGLCFDVRENSARNAVFEMFQGI